MNFFEFNKSSAILLDELFRSLINKKGQERLTDKEASIFAGRKSEALGSFAVGGSIATALTWIATRKLNNFNRVTVAGGAGFITGMWRLNKSIDSCVDRILRMDGTRMQLELKKIILEKFGNDPEKMQPFSKHFYCEDVFYDSTSGHPKPVYRQQNLYVDIHRTDDGNTSHESVKKGASYQQKSGDSSVKLNSGGTEIKQVPMSTGISIFGYGDPLDVLFGHSSANDEVNLPSDSEKSAKGQSHSQKRARRRHRLRRRRQESLSQLHAA